MASSDSGLISDLSIQRQALVSFLVAAGILRSPNIIRAMLRVPREEFLPIEWRNYSYVDASLPIGWGQTTSAPHMVAILSEQAGLREGYRVLEIGTGLGYMACVYAEAVAPIDSHSGRWGHVWSAEIVGPLAIMADSNVKRTGFANRVTILHRDASGGIPEYAPYDVIIVAAAGPRIPGELVEEIAPRGVLLMPIGNAREQTLVRVRKLEDETTVREDLGLTRFVPLVGTSGWTRW